MIIGQKQIAEAVKRLAVKHKMLDVTYALHIKPDGTCEIMAYGDTTENGQKKVISVTEKV